MLTVATAAAIGRSCSASNKADVESGAVVVVVCGYVSLFSKNAASDHDPNGTRIFIFFQLHLLGQFFITKYNIV